MSASSDTFDPSIQSENIAFQQEQLIACDRCGRQNPPNRLECLYCGAVLNVSPDALGKISVRKLESWEPGVNLVISSGGGNVSKAAELLGSDAEMLEEIISAEIPLPIARVEEKTTPILIAKLEAMGFAVRSVADAELTPGKMPVRISGMRIDDEGINLIDFNVIREDRYSWGELRLIVKGTFSSGKIDSMEKRRLRKTTLMSETITSADEPVFDFYTGDDLTGYRVQLAGFDYSCLGDEMGPLATENMSRLLRRISSRAPDAKLVDDYKRVRHLLTGIWDVESRKDPKGLQQVGFGKREFGMVHSTNNVEQFTRFSRLQRLML
ncbi:MAG: hypothetical protein ACJ73D_03260 [Pyrinomonadaceae bacterium]